MYAVTLIAAGDAHDTGTSTLSVVTLVIALVALIVNVSALLRRPKIRVFAGEVQESPPMDAIVVTVTARRRPVEVTGLGLVRLPSTWRRRVPRWFHVESPPRLQRVSRVTLPVTLQDGESIDAFIDSEDEEAYYALNGSGTIYVFVEASGVTYLKGWGHPWSEAVSARRRKRRRARRERAPLLSKDPDDYRHGRRRTPFLSKNPDDYR